MSRSDGWLLLWRRRRPSTAAKYPQKAPLKIALVFNIAVSSPSTHTDQALTCRKNPSRESVAADTVITVKGFFDWALGERLPLA
jgi:hypothetical protein